jgi:hypothetical protein
LFPEGKPVVAVRGNSRSEGSVREKVRGNRRRILVGPSGTAVAECSSGIVTQGDDQISSLFVAKVPASELPDTPGGCTVQTG